jgi:DNA-directed RNA polymerase specialized sigma24 family protein
VAGDEASVAFVRANSDSLFHTACLLTGSKTAAEDLLQETLAKLYGQRVERVEAPFAYVRRCLNNNRAGQQSSLPTHRIAVRLTSTNGKYVLQAEPVGSAAWHELTAVPCTSLGGQALKSGPA